MRGGQDPGDRRGHVGAALRRVVPRRPRVPVADRPLAVLVLPGADVPASVSRVLAATHVLRGPPVRG